MYGFVVLIKLFNIYLVTGDLFGVRLFISFSCPQIWNKMHVIDLI